MKKINYYVIGGWNGTSTGFTNALDFSGRFYWIYI